MALFTNKYQKTGFLYSLMLSFIYLPLVLGIIETNSFIENQVLNFLVFVSFTITFITTINYKIILFLKNKDSKYINKFFFVPVNILIMLFIYLFMPFEIEANIFAFSFLFIMIPWMYFFMNIWEKHIITFKNI